MQSFEEREKIVNYGLIHIIDNDRLIRKIFNKENYSKEFQALYDLYIQALTAYNYLYDAHSNPEEFAHETAKKIVDHEIKKLDEITNKSKKRNKTIDDSVYVALFSIPVINHFHAVSTDQLIDFLVEEWHKNFPDNLIERGSFEEINQGFRARRSIIDIFRSF